MIIFGPQNIFRIKESVTFIKEKKILQNSIEVGEENKRKLPFYVGLL